MIKILRLSTGEDVIGDVIDQGTEIVKVKNAFAIIPMQGGPGQPTKLAFTLYAPYTDDKEIELKTPNVINQTTPKKELQNSYNQHLGTGIIQPKNPGLITETTVPNMK